MRKIVLFLIVVGLFGYFVWPTQYRAFGAGEGPYARQVGASPYRVDRVSGQVLAPDASGQWLQVDVRRPELLHPEITAPTPATRPDTRPAQRTMQEAQNVQSATDAITRSATQKAKPVGQ